MNSKDHKTVEQMDEQALLSAADIAVYMGICRGKAYRIMNDKSFPSFKIGRQKFVMKRQLISWIDSQVTKHQKSLSSSEKCETCISNYESEVNTNEQ